MVRASVKVYIAFVAEEEGKATAGAPSVAAAAIVAEAVASSAGATTEGAAVGPLVVPSGA